MKGVSAVFNKRKSTPRLVGKQDSEEFPDTKLGAARRGWILSLAPALADQYELNTHDLMFFAGALEEVARERRGES